MYEDLEELYDELDRLVQEKKQLEIKKNVLQEIVDCNNLRQIKVSKKKETWKKHTNRRVAIFLCMAFENFIRNHLAENIIGQVSGNGQDWLAGFCKRLSGDNIIGSFYEFYDECRNSKKTAIIKLIELIDTNKFLYFTSKENIEKAYNKCLGCNNGDSMDIFGCFETIGSEIFSDANEEKAAFDDVWMLFKIRNQIIHFDGLALEKYRMIMDPYLSRLNVISNNQRVEGVPIPDVILDPQVSRGINSDISKIEEIKNSLSKCVRYLSERMASGSTYHHSSTP